MIYNIIGLSILVALINGFYGKKEGYSFSRQFITGFIAAAGIITIIYKLIKDYF
jgi:hypothetical protein